VARDHAALASTCEFLRSQDIVLLQELGAATALSNIEAKLPQHTVYASDHTNWRRGKGVAVALRAPLARALVGPPRVDGDLQLVHARLRGLLPGSNALLHVISCYMLCKDSEQLAKDSAARSTALEAHYAALQCILDDITASAPGDLVVLAGDLNAKTGPAQALGPASLAALLAAGLPTQRSYNTPPDHPGHLLNDLCAATDVINLTGIAPGDCPAQPSFSPAFKSSPAPPSSSPPEPLPRAARTTSSSPPQSSPTCGAAQRAPTCAARTTSPSA
jgi:hypothetical protein